jgi:hypothetical protein
MLVIMTFSLRLLYPNTNYCDLLFRHGCPTSNGLDVCREICLAPRLCYCCSFWTLILVALVIQKIYNFVDMDNLCCIFVLKTVFIMALDSRMQ